LLRNPDAASKGGAIRCLDAGVHRGEDRQRGRSGTHSTDSDCRRQGRGPGGVRM